MVGIRPEYPRGWLASRAGQGDDRTEELSPDALIRLAPRAARCAVGSTRRTRTRSPARATTNPLFGMVPVSDPVPWRSRRVEYLDL